MSLFALAPWQIALCFAPALVNLWAIWHAARHDFCGEMERPLWIVAAVFLPLLGGLLYLVFGLRRSMPKGTR